MFNFLSSVLGQDARVYININPSKLYIANIYDSICGFLLFIYELLYQITIGMIMSTDYELFKGKSLSSVDIIIPIVI